MKIDRNTLNKKSLTNLFLVRLFLFFGLGILLLSLIGIIDPTTLLVKINLKTHEIGYTKFFILHSFLFLIPALIYFAFNVGGFSLPKYILMIHFLFTLTAFLVGLIKLSGIYSLEGLTYIILVFISLLLFCGAIIGAFFYWFISSLKQ